MVTSEAEGQADRYWSYRSSRHQQALKAELGNDTLQLGRLYKDTAGTCQELDREGSVRALGQILKL